MYLHEIWTKMRLMLANYHNIILAGNACSNCILTESVKSSKLLSEKCPEKPILAI